MHNQLEPLSPSPSSPSSTSASGEDVLSTIDAGGGGGGAANVNAASTQESPTLAQLKLELAEARQLLAQREEIIEALERRQRIDELLRSLEPVDLGAARLLTEAAIATMSEPDVQAAVDELVRNKPWLFAAGRAAGVKTSVVSGAKPHAAGTQRAAAVSSPMSPRSSTAKPAAKRAAVDDLAQQAAATGNRQTLLRYMRLKRT